MFSDSARSAAACGIILVSSVELVETGGGGEPDPLCVFGTESGFTSGSEGIVFADGYLLLSCSAYRKETKLLTRKLIFGPRVLVDFVVCACFTKNVAFPSGPIYTERRPAAVSPHISTHLYVLQQKKTRRSPR